MITRRGIAVLLLLSGMAGWARVGAQPRATRVELGALALGSRLERSLATGQRGIYRVRAAAGESLRVTVEQPGLLTIAVISPAGATVAERARVEPLDGPERLSWVAAAAGVYRLELRPRDPTRAAGVHAVRLDAQALASVDDTRRARAERAFERGDALRQVSTAESFRQAAQSYADALADFRAIGDDAGQADALLGVGLTRRAQSENTQALEAYQASLPFRRAARDRWGEAFTLQNIGLVYRTWGELDDARDHYTRALEVARSSGDRRGEADGLNGFSRVAFDQGDYASALLYNEQALPITRAIGDRRGESYALNSIGTIYWAWGDGQRAFDVFGQAVALREAIGDRLGASNSIANLANALLQAGRPREALPYVNRALAIVRELGNRRSEGQEQGTAGDAYLALGDLRSAGAAYARSVELAAAVGDRPLHFASLAGLARVQARQGDAETALRSVASALELARAQGDPEAEAQVLLSRAAVERLQRRLPQALSSVTDALELIEVQRRRIPNDTLRGTYLASMREAFELRIDVLMTLAAAEGTPARAADALQASEQARARVFLDSLAETRWNVREGVEPELLARESDVRRRLNAAAARMAAATPRDDRAALSSAVDAMVEEYQRVEADIRLRSPRYATLTQPEPLTLAQIQHDVVDDGSVLLEYALGEERSYVWVVTPTTFAAHVLPARAVIERAARAAHDAVEASHRPGRGAAARAALAAVGRLILQPVAGALGDKRLIVVPDGALQFVPFAALPRPATGAAPADPLVVRHEIVELPSASIVPVLRATTRARAAEGVAVFADPVLTAADARLTARAPTTRRAPNAVLPADLTRSMATTGLQFERLRYTRREAEAIRQLSRGRPSLIALDFDASRNTALRAELAQYRYLHFASHAIVNTAHPELSGIVLSLVNPDGTPQDGFLRLHDIYNMKLNADLVVLSACQTALGRDVRGEGLIGLTRGFMYAGAPRVVASLWDVRDEQTSELMTRMYRALLQDGLRPAAALRQAQLALLRDPARSAPAYWAGFVLQGEWR